MGLTVLVPGAPRLVAGRPVPVGPGQQRKIGLLGAGIKSLACTPWLDPSWTFWVHASSVLSIPHLRADRIFDLHPRHVFTMERKNGFKNYYEFLRQCPTVIYMQNRYEDIPQSVRYPLEMVRQQWPNVPLGSTTAYMIALALLEGVTHIGMWGLDYQAKSEYEEQRPNVELWCGIAMGMGVQLVIPSVSPLCHEPKRLYGYESHTPELYAERLEKKRLMHEALVPKGHLTAQSKLEPIVGQAGLDAAAELRRQKDPALAAAIAAMKDEEPAWLPKLGV